jgi:glycosyltransferase involved in cell wall biosynthesis
MMVMISYEITIGFAIGRLIRVFHEVARRLTGGDETVHFSFSAVGGQHCSNLPDDFAHVLEFDYRRPDASSLERFVEYVKRHDITTVMALDLAPGADFLRAARSAGVRNVIAYWGAPMSSENRGLKLLLKKLEVATLHRSRPDLFIFESEAMRRLAVRGRGISAAATDIVHTGVDAQKFRPMPAHISLAHERFAIPANQRIVVYMGHLHERKGVHVLMQAMTYMVRHEGRGDLHALFLGNRADEAEGFAEHWNPASSHITFGGYQSDIPQLLAGCHVGCIPSTGWDSFPMSSLEMQACGLPVVVSDWQGVPETVDAGVTGIVVPVGNAPALARALLSTVDEPGLRDRLSEAARRRIEKAFTIEHQVKNLLETIRAHAPRES